MANPNPLSRNPKKNNDLEGAGGGFQYGVAIFSLKTFLYKRINP